MTDLGSVGAAAVTTIGTIATVGIAAKVAHHAMKSAGGLPKSKSNYRVLKGSRPKVSRKKSKSYSVFG